MVRKWDDIKLLMGVTFEQVLRGKQVIAVTDLPSPGLEAERQVGLLNHMGREFGISTDQLMMVTEADIHELCNGSSILGNEIMMIPESWLALWYGNVESPNHVKESFEEIFGSDYKQKWEDHVRQRMFVVDEDIVSWDEMENVWNQQHRINEIVMDLRPWWSQFTSQNNLHINWQDMVNYACGQFSSKDLDDLTDGCLWTYYINEVGLDVGWDDLFETWKFQGQLGWEIDEIYKHLWEGFTDKFGQLVEWQDVVNGGGMRVLVHDTIWNNFSAQHELGIIWDDVIDNLNEQLHSGDLPIMYLRPRCGDWDGEGDRSWKRYAVVKVRWWENKNWWERSKLPNIRFIPIKEDGNNLVVWLDDRVYTGDLLEKHKPEISRLYKNGDEQTLSPRMRQVARSQGITVFRSYDVIVTKEVIERMASQVRIVEVEAGAEEQKRSEVSKKNPNIVLHDLKGCDDDKWMEFLTKNH